MWSALLMAFPVGGVWDGADHPEATSSVPSRIGVTRMWAIATNPVERMDPD